MQPESNAALQRILRFARLFAMTPRERKYLRAVQASGMFDPVYYRGAYPLIHPFYHKFPERHYVLYGEARGFRPNPDFSPGAYLRYNPDVGDHRIPPFYHYVTTGHAEGRLTKELPKAEDLPALPMRARRILAGERRSRQALVAHVYYPDLWPEFARTIKDQAVEFDLYVTLTYRSDETDELARQIVAEFPDALVLPVENRGRDILPFLRLVNAGVLDGYDAICKIHTKKSPHRDDGDLWRKHLIGGILPGAGLPQMLETFRADPSIGFWVADGQHYHGTEWWGTNFEVTRALMQRLEIDVDRERLDFPAGSIYWMKPALIGLLKALRLDENDFEPEQAQLDGTLAHALERSMGMIARAGGYRVVQSAELAAMAPPAPPARPQFVSAFYLPQFHPVPENDLWWGKGFTEWHNVTHAAPARAGHRQPVLPTDLGFYDLRLPETMGAQAELARASGVDAFCVYHYWFGGRRILEKPVDNLLSRPDVEFPFYLCWANESWRRNWDGLSGEVLLEQDYAKGFEKALAENVAHYMRDPRYARPDGNRPRFVIYRPDDMPEPVASVARLREAWRAMGIGEVEIGAVRFHITGDKPLSDALFDFWIEMAPHGLVQEKDYLFGGPQGDRTGGAVRPGFTGLIYDYNGVIENALSPGYLRKLPKNTICGAMPCWDNTAQRGASAHLAWGANPASFDRWLREISQNRLQGSYRQELFLNAWNEWAEKAILEPSDMWGDQYLQVLRAWLRPEGAQALSYTAAVPPAAASA